MTTTITAPSPAESADVYIARLADAHHQGILDEQAEELRDLAAQGVRRKAPEGDVTGTGRPADVLAWIDLLDGLDPLAEAISLAAGKSELTGSLRYTKAEVLGWFARAVEKGCAVPRVRPGDVEGVFRLKRVPNARLRQEYERRVEAGQEGLPSRLARAIGAMRGPGSDDPDTAAALRALGVDSAPTGRKDYLPSLRLFMTYDQAVAMADELGLTYHDVGV